MFSTVVNMLPYRNMEPSIIFLGVAVSLLVQLWKRWTNVSGLMVSVFALGLSLLTAILYAVLDEYGLMDAVWGVLGTASITYTFIIRQLESR